MKMFQFLINSTELYFWESNVVSTDSGDGVKKFTSAFTCL